MTTNILEILGVAGKEDVITNLLKYAIDESETFRVKFLQEICGLEDVRPDDKVKAVTRILAGEAGIPDLVIWRKGNNKSDFIILENKLKAEEGFEQTRRYEDLACVQSLRNNPKLEIPEDAVAHFIYLTLFDDPVSKSAFVHKRYSDVLSILKQMTFDINNVADKLLDDLKTILHVFYSFGNVSPENLLKEKLMERSLLEGSYLYFNRLFSKNSFQPPNGLWLECTFRSSAPGRRFFGAQFIKDGWNVKEMEKPLQGKWRLDSKLNMSIHFEPQYNLLTRI